MKFLIQKKKTNTTTHTAKTINLYFSVAGEEDDIKKIKIDTEGYLGVTSDTVLGRSGGRVKYDWKKTCSTFRFRDAVVANGSIAYKFVKIEASGEEALDEKLKYVLEKCYFEFIKDVGLSNKLFNRNRAERSYGGILARYIPNESERSQLGAFLAGQLIGGRHKFVEGGIHTIKRSIPLPRVERKTQKF